MHEISPVLAGTWSQPEYVAANAATSLNATPDALSSTSTNAVSTVGTSDTASVDARRYSKFDRTATDAGSTTNFTFSDFLDMINPLQHIPVVSSVYREITGDKINPVSRVAGDIIYGGAVGVASGILGCVSAAADTVAESETGKDKLGNLVASLFGTDDKSSTAQTQLAGSDASGVPSSSAPAPVTQVASAPLSPPSSNGTIPLASRPQALASPQALAAASPAVAAASAASEMAAGASKMASADTAPALNRSKLAFGGVMAPTGTTQEQNMTMALASSSRGMRIGNTIYTSPLMNGRHPLPVASTPTTSTANAQTNSVSVTPSLPPSMAGAPTAQMSSLAASTPGLAATMADPSTILATSAASMRQSSAIASSSMAPSAKNLLPASLSDDSLVLKALDQYRSVAGGSSSLQSGSKYDVLN